MRLARDCMSDSLLGAHPNDVLPGPVRLDPKSRKTLLWRLGICNKISWKCWAWPEEVAMSRSCARTLLNFGIAMLFVIGVGVEPTAAKECSWFGTAPLCDGRCPAGWTLENLSGAGCVGTIGISSTKAYCCKVEAKVRCGPGRYGTPGCPYPLFPKRDRTLDPIEPGAKHPCGKGNFLGADGKCYPILR